jgi:hypothetical protein
LAAAWPAGRGTHPGSRARLSSLADGLDPIRPLVSCRSGAYGAGDSTTQGIESRRTIEAAVKRGAIHGAGVRRWSGKEGLAEGGWRTVSKTGPTAATTSEQPGGQGASQAPGDTAMIRDPCCGGHSSVRWPMFRSLAWSMLCK